MVLTRRSLLTLFLFGIFLTLLGAVQAGDFSIEIVSLFNNGAVGKGIKPSVSAHGRLIAFESTQRLVPADTLSFRDVFVRDRATNQTLLVSVSDDEVLGNGPSYLPTISRNGRYVVFYSTADNFFDNDNANSLDLFLRDVDGGNTYHIAPSTYIGMTQADITPDGRYVTFSSNVDGIVVGDTNDEWDVYRYDRDTQQFALVSATSGGAPGNNASESPVISDDGRYIFFQSRASDLVTGDTNITYDVFRRDMQSSEIVRVSVSNGGVQGNQPSKAPAISGDGRYVAFQTQAGNLASFPTGGTQIIVRDMQTGQNTLASITPDGLDDGNGVSEEPTITDDGRFVAFASTSSNLTATNNANSKDIFIRDLQSNVTTQANLTNAGGAPSDNADSTDISPDGYFVGFLTGSALVPGGGTDTLYLSSNIFLPNATAFNVVPQTYYFDALPAKLTWNAITWAQEYEIQVADNTGFASATSYFKASGILAHDLTTLENGTYYWHVRARDAANVWGSWSAIQTFELEVE